jgi:hypothetical protein
MLEDLFNRTVRGEVTVPQFIDAIEAWSRTRRAPVQRYAPGIPWSLHLEAYAAYCKKYGPQEELIKGWCRGGFDTGELDMFIPGWRDRVNQS